MSQSFARLIAGVILATAVMTASAMGEEKGGTTGGATGGTVASSIQNRLAVRGVLGFNIPSDSDFQNLKINTDISFIGGGGVIYGIQKNVAVEFDVTYTWFGSSLPNGGDTGDFSITNIAFGGQYRFVPADKVHPYVGAGLDILINEYDHGDVDTVVGGHISGGMDYFFMPNMAFNAELRAVLAPDADIKVRGEKVGNFSPPSISGLFGIRYFF